MRGGSSSVRETRGDTEPNLAFTLAFLEVTSVMTTIFDSDSILPLLGIGGPH
jgi:hypothetical protein